MMLETWWRTTGFIPSADLQISRRQTPRWFPAPKRHRSGALVGANSPECVSFCVYSSAQTLIQGFSVNRGAALCSGKPCWKAKGTKGWGYQDKAVSADGIAKIGFGSGDVEKGVASVAGKNDAGKGLTSLPTGFLTTLSAEVSPTIQVQTNNDFCVGATLDEVTKNDGGQYNARLK